MRRAALNATFLFIAALFAAAFVFGQEDVGVKRPKYVFVFIGDGTSFPQRHAAELYRASLDSVRSTGSGSSLSPDGVSPGGTFEGDTSQRSDPAIQRLVMNTFPIQGLCTTHSLNSLVTDSSASGTAIATGRKTLDGVIGMDAEGKTPLVSMAKIAREQGRKVGIVTSVSLDHATPASFYASQPSRNEYYEIAIQAPATGFDYFAGGGFKQVAGREGDQKNVFDIFREYGYRIVTSRAEFDVLAKGGGDDKVLAISPILDENDALPYTVDRQPGDGDIVLAEFVHKGIELLDNDDGFFMMVEGGKIDWACHANDAFSAVNEVIAFDEAVEVAYGFYREHMDETLIVVTGDHETGGMAIGFTGTGYDAYPYLLGNQRGSYSAFDKRIKELREQNPRPALEAILPVVLEFFGLELHEPEELERLWVAAAEGDARAAERLRRAVQPYDMEKIIQSLVMSWRSVGERPRDYGFYVLYGGYEPVTVAMTRILNNKAGIGWTTFAHSGLPVPVSAIGVGAERFSGHYDNTDIFTRIVSIAY